MGDVVTPEEAVHEVLAMPFCGGCGVPTLLSLYEATEGAWWPCVVCYTPIQRNAGPFLEALDVEQMSESDFRLYAEKVRKIQAAKARQ